MSYRTKFTFNHTHFFFKPYPLTIILCQHTGLQKKECRAFIVDGIQVGLVRATVTIELSRYPNVFIVNPNSVTLNPAFRDYDERSANIESVLKEMKEKKLFITLKGWRDEVLTHASFIDITISDLFSILPA